MTMRLGAIYLCIALFHCVMCSDDITGFVIGKTEEIRSPKDNGVVSGYLIEAKEVHLDFFTAAVNLNDFGNRNNTNGTNSTIKVSCLVTKSQAQPVEIVNSTYLTTILQTEANITSRQTPANCVAVLFYSPSCPFSCGAAPHFNALPWYFPDIKMVAIDALTYRNFNVQFGIFGVPTLILFHNGKPAARLNKTSYYNIGLFVKFIQNHTNLEPTYGKLEVNYDSFKGPLMPVPSNDRDYYLVLSWGVIILQLLYSFYRSSWGRWLVDASLSAWREAEAQHHHID